MNFDLLKQKLLNVWQGMQGARQGQGQAVQNWQQNVAPLQQIVKQPNTVMPDMQGLQKQLMQSQMMQHLMSLFGGQNAR